MGAGTGESAGPSLAARAALAVLLTVVFYALALAVGVGLIAAPIVLYATAGMGNIWVALAMFGAGFVVLRAIVPTRGRFEPPDPELDSASQPELHGLLDEVATDVGELPVRDVYLDLDVNAAVAEVSQGIGRPRRRVMIVGLPLLAALSPAELRAVMGHEFGHYVGGDTRFSAWIWRTRVALMRAVGQLGVSDSWFQRHVVRGPFALYAMLFERLTAAVSRRQELAADAVAARIGGAEPAGSALRRVSASSAAFAAYWDQDVTFALEQQKRPPIADGFQRFLGANAIAARLDEVVAADLQAGEADAYSSHPTLGQRLEALGDDDASLEPLEPGETALALLHDVPRLERELLGQRFGAELDTDFDEVEWNGVGELRVRQSEALVERFGAIFAEHAVGDAASLVSDPSSLRLAVRAELGDEATGADDAALDEFIGSVITSLVTNALGRAGWTIEAPPGEPISASRDEWTITLGLDLAQLNGSEEDETRIADWRDRSSTAGIAALPLVPVEAEGAHLREGSPSIETSGA